MTAEGRRAGEAIASSAPELARRCARALTWLDPDNELPLTMRHGASPTEKIALAIATVIVSAITGADRRERARMARLLDAILAEAVRVRRVRAA